MTWILSLSAAFTLLIVLFTIRIWAHQSRAKRFRGLELKTNCLLTRYPLIFITKQKSLFAWRRLIRDEWNDIPKYLREHGYEVLLLTPHNSAALSSVLSALDAMESKCHIIGAENDFELVESLAELKHSRVASLTLAKSDKRGLARLFAELGSTHQRKISTQDLRPRPTAVEIVALKAPSKNAQWEIEGRFLEHAISLAERDAGWCD